MLIVPNDYFKLMTKCPDFMIVGQVFRSKNTEIYYQVFVPFELKPSLPHQVAVLEKSTSLEELELKFIKNAISQIIISAEKTAKIKKCLITKIGTQSIIYQ